ncbi:hypothetical protein EVC03_090 [Rhizobium phage RHph_Y5A]|nr:hypothetical protein EVC03_090 [Rhizobium phage RHph_Y5A]QIG75532.1 hypothetical protein EVC18_090 [Rhizobium phage RHph_Y2_4]
MNMNIANTILFQLGGGRFVSDVQASCIAACNGGITFRTANACVMITLEVDGFRVRFTDPNTGALIEEYSRVSVERLISLFRR